MAKGLDLVAFLNDSVSKCSGIRGGRKALTQGDKWGVELEMEGRGVGFEEGEDVPRGWRADADGSLRNNHGESVEWVSDKPYELAEVKTSVTKLFDMFDNREAKIVPSNRTSTHVHFNMADKQNFQVVSLFIVYTVFEDILGRWCGDERNGNCFALPVRHASDYLNVFRRSVFDFGNWLEFTPELRYAGLNLSALNKFGSVEFRSMRGASNPEEVLQWLDILNELVIYSLEKFPGPDKFFSDLSVHGCREMTKIVFPQTYPILVNNVSQRELEESLYEGLRLVQMLAFRFEEAWEGIKRAPKDFWKEEAKKLKGVNNVWNGVPGEEGVFRPGQIVNVQGWGEVAPMAPPRPPEPIDHPQPAPAAAPNRDQFDNNVNRAQQILERERQARREAVIGDMAPRGPDGLPVVRVRLRDGNPVGAGIPQGMKVRDIDGNIFEKVGNVWLSIGEDEAEF